jgi:hypothetical protein
MASCASVDNNGTEWKMLPFHRIRHIVCQRNNVAFLPPSLLLARSIHVHSLYIIYTIASGA